MNLVLADVADDGVSAPGPEVPGLRALVQQVRGDGIDLKVVVMGTNPPLDTTLRDVATVVGSDFPDATVVVLSPSYVGTYSRQFTRAKLEAAEDHAKSGTSVEKVQNFLADVDTPSFPWTAFTIFLVIAVATATAATRILQRRGTQPATPQATRSDAETE